MSITVQSNNAEADAKVNNPTEAKAPAPQAEGSPAPSLGQADGQAQEKEQKEVTADSGPAAEVDESETETASDGTETEQSTEPEAQNQDGKTGKGINKRFSKLTKRATAAEARAFAAEQELEVMRQRLALRGAGETDKHPGTDQKPAAAEGKPDPNKFETHEAYLDARDEWNRKQWRAEQERDRRAAEQAQVQTTYADKVAAFSKEHPDYEEVMATTESVTSPIIEQVIVTSHIGPALRYELAKNPDEALRIAKLPPVTAAKELGKLEDRLAKSSAPTKEPKPETKRVSSAPAPINPVAGGGKGGAPKSLDELAKTDFAAYKRAREEELKKQRRRA